jgi:CheY-like chemotaxis protein
MMPKMDGFVLYERLKTIDPAVKVCFLTASEMYHEESRKMEHSTFNSNLYLHKPISTEDLIMEINKKINSRLWNKHYRGIYKWSILKKAFRLCAR